MNETYNGVNIKRTPLLGRGKGKAVSLVINYLSFALITSISAPFIIKNDYDLIFVYEPSPITVGIPAIILKKLYKIPIIFWVQDLWPESISATGAINSNIVYNLVSKLVKYIYENCNLILVQSKGFIESIRKYEIESKKILYFPNSAENIYRPIINKDLSSYHEELPKGFRVLFAGNIGTAQSMETILDAAKLLKLNKKIKIIIIGHGRLKAWVDKQVKVRQLSDIVTVLGKRPVEEMPKYFSVSDILLATLKNEKIFSLTIPSKIQSYLACAKPIITAIGGVTSDIINESGAGIAVEPENPKLLADAITLMCNKSDEERLSMGINGRKYFQENFNSERLLSQLENWMHEVVA